MLRRVLILFFVSGALGLGYQVLWSKLVFLFVGVSSWSYAIVLAAFMAGLALGSRLLGPVADRASSPLKLFGFLELGVGAYAVAYPALADAAGHAYLRFAAAYAGEPGGARQLALKAVVAGLLLVPPTFLMGGTYPALVRHAATSVGAVGRRASQLYAVNAAGAVLGALTMAMTFIPGLGLRASLMILALGNALVGALAVTAARGSAAASRAPAPLPERSATPHPGPAPAGRPVLDPVRFAIAVAFVAGFLSFGLEVAWTRAFSVVMGSSTQSFAAILAAFITGISAGSFLLSRVESRLRQPVAAFGAVQIVTGLLVVLPLPLLQYVPWVVGRVSRHLPPTELGFQAWGLLKLATCLSVMLLPCLGMGVSIPLLIKGVSRRVEAVGADTGSVYAWNTAGNVLGALLAGMVLLPALGVERLIGWSGGALAVAGAAAVLLGTPRPVPRRTALLSCGGAALAAGLLVVLPAWNPAWLSITAFRRMHVGTWAATREGIARRDIVYLRDDPAANVMVLRGRDESAGHLSLLVNGKPDASNLGDQPTQLLLGHLPLLLRGDAESVLVIGLASGVTSGAVLRHPVKRLDIVDIVRCMPEAAAWFDEWSGRPLSDPRTRFIADDARSWLVSTKDRYDVVISEPSNPWTAGTGSLFSTEFYREASKRLRPGGIYVQWLQAYELSDELLAATIRSFRTVFPHVTLWETATLDVVIIGSAEPLQPDLAAMGAAMQAPAIASQLAILQLGTPEELLFLQRFSEATIDWIAATAERENTDDNLLLEHEAPRDLFLLASPSLLSNLDERRAASPALAWTAPLREAREDLLAIPRLMGHRTFGTAQLLASWLAAATRARGTPFADLPEDVRTALPPGVGEPMSHEALVASLGDAVARDDLGRLTELLSAERTAIALESVMSADAAEAWRSELTDLASRADGRAAASLRLVACDALAAADRGPEALAELHASLATQPPATVDEVLVRACRIDPGAGCETLARKLLETTGDPRVGRFLRLRAPR